MKKRAALAAEEAVPFNEEKKESGTCSKRSCPIPRRRMARAAEEADPSDKKRVALAAEEAAPSDEEENGTSSRRRLRSSSRKRRSFTINLCQ